METKTKSKQLPSLPFAKFPVKSFNVSELKAVTFDAYGTVLFSNTECTPPSHKVWCVLSNYISYHTGIRYKPEELCGKFFKFKDLEKQTGLERANGEPFEIDEGNVYRRLMPGADEHSIYTAAEIFRATTADPSFGLFRGVKEFIIAAKQRGLKISFSSNAQRIYNTWEFKALGIYDLFDNVESGLSSEVFWKKPSKNFFHSILENLGVQPHEVLNIGNYKVDDINPPRSIGIHTCLLNSERQECNTPEDCDFFFEYPDSDDLPDSYYPFFRLKEYLFG